MDNCYTSVWGSQIPLRAIAGIQNIWKSEEHSGECMIKCPACRWRNESLKDSVMCLWPLRSWRACPRSWETDSRDSVLPTFHMTLRCFVLAHRSSLFFEVTEKFIVGNSENKIALLIFYLQTDIWAVVMPIAPDVWHEDTTQTSTHSWFLSGNLWLPHSYLPSFVSLLPLSISSFS